MTEERKAVQGFSFQSRQKALERFRAETFDLLVIGGGITGAAVARDATSRGLKVALVERKDFAFGTSSRSSKLIHGGLRYLQNLEMGLVFEALAERAFLLKTAPHMVRPLPFYFPVYQQDTHGRGILSLGLWLYDLLALFRAPGFHKSLTCKKLLSEIPFLKKDGLLGGFRYYDASMWDDALVIETARAAHEQGAAIANYVEAVSPLWEGDRIVGFRLRDWEHSSSAEFSVKAHRTVVCAGPWTDQMGERLSKQWSRWLTPSKGVHLVFDLKRIPIPGAMVMTNASDGRVAFVIPRVDYGAGVVIVGTTDGPTSLDPEKAEVTSKEVDYLLDLLRRYFPDLNLTSQDILSAYVGVRPLMGPQDKAGETESKKETTVLQKVSREHYIDQGPGGCVIVAGGKYTTHRRMAEEIVDYTLKKWREDSKSVAVYPKSVSKSHTDRPVNSSATLDAIQTAREKAKKNKQSIPDELWNRYGARALDFDLEKSSGSPEGFPVLAEQLRFAIRNEMVMHLEDFYLRRAQLFLARKDHGLPWAEELVKVLAEERDLSPAEQEAELLRLKQEVARRSAWENR